ncbi:MAG: cupin domain-containing protein [Chloroflexi bacterium]|nr:cupin domain-containing protein [Chloroflexota bacterium]MDA1271623.1 cupin domain-containing protein [Chloroflexota bacterium]
MPIIDHSEVRLAPTTERVRERYLVSKDQGAVSLTVKEVEISPGWEGRMHTHPVDVSIQVLSGAIQVIMDDETRTVRAGTTLLAPPGMPHKMIHHLWTPALLLITYPSAELETHHLE